LQQQVHKRFLSSGLLYPLSIISISRAAELVIQKKKRSCGSVGSRNGRGEIGYGAQKQSSSKGSKQFPR
jgi:hypothetical protein